jgi:hypothetical protein
MMLLLMTMVFAASELPEITVPPAGLIDAIEFSEAASESAHRFGSGGRVSQGIAGDLVGGHDMRHPVRTLEEEGSFVSFQVRLQPGSVNTLEIEEVYGREHGVRGYLILLDDEPVYFRNWEARGAGPVHYFVQLPTSEKASATVKLVNCAPTSVRVSRAWVFADLERYVEEHELDVPFFMAPTLRLGFLDPEADVAKVLQIRESVGAHRHVKPAWTTWIGYAQLSDREIVRQIDHVLEVADKAQMPVQICLDTWWAQTPMGTDGSGGSWLDIPYQQVVYNQTQQRYQLSIPNQWSNTPWLTVNHPHLNEFKTRRLHFAASHLAARYRELLAEGHEDLILAINLDNEPVYWASGNAGLGSDLLLADFNAATVEKARRDGVRLDPEAGLDHEARLWLSRNLLEYNELIASAAAEALGRDAAVVDADGVRPAGDLLRHNIYTQAVVSNADITYPMLDERWPFWETAAPASARVGGEWNSNSERVIEGVTHQIALGRNAAVNAECSNDPQKIAGVLPAYTLGQRYIALYNYPLDQMHVAAAELDDLSHAVPPFVYQKVLLETRFDTDEWRDQVFSHEHIQTGLIGNTAAVAAFSQSNQKPGVLAYRLEAPSEAFDGLAVELNGRAFVHRAKDAAVHMRVLAGPTEDPAGMREAGRFHDSGDLGMVRRYDLTDAARERPHIFVRIEIHAPGVPDDVMSWCSVYRIRFTTPWPAGLMRDLPPQDHSPVTLRRQNLLVSWRRDAELAIASLQEYLRNSGPDDATWNLDERHAPLGKLEAARASCVRGGYAEAYRLANEGLCVALPATFHVLAERWLDPYRIRVSSTGPVIVTVEQWSPEVVRFKMIGDMAGEGHVMVAGLPPGAEYTVIEKEDGWTIRPAPPAADGATLSTDAAGVLSVPVTIRSAEEPPREQEIPGMLVGRDARSIHILRNDGHGGLRFLIDDRTTILRGTNTNDLHSVDVADLQRGDQVVVQMHDDGRAGEVTAVFALVEGTIRRYEPATPFAMPAITIDETGVRHIIDLSAPLQLDEAAVTLRADPLRPVDLVVGQRVRLRINPSTGRVFQLWTEP